LLLALSFFVADLLELKTLSFLLEKVFTLGILAIIVVFQPELRRALEKVGRTKVADLSLFSTFEQGSRDAALWEGAIEAISKSCDQLSKEKIGALIVIERKTKLGEQIAQGVFLDAMPSVELFGNIFFPNSPLHDGAVIIRNGKIVAASCFLPKPHKEEMIDNNLGSRHRAALGMSENSDAVVVVVSEETGIISIAYEGRLTRGFDAYNLRKYLKKMLIADEEQEPKKAKFWRAKK
jgi:diadenylate cyclase